MSLSSYHLLASTAGAALGLRVTLSLPGTSPQCDDLQRTMAVTSLPHLNIVCMPLLANSNSEQQREEGSGQHSILRLTFFTRHFHNLPARFPYYGVFAPL